MSAKFTVNGAGNYGIISHNNLLNASTTWGCYGIFRTTVNYNVRGSNGYFFNKSAGGGGANFSVGISSAGGTPNQLIFFFSDGTNSLFMFANITVIDGFWHSFAAFLNATVLTIFVDDRSIGSTSNGSYTGQGTNTGDLFIGNFSNTHSSALVGDLAMLVFTSYTTFTEREFHEEKWMHGRRFSMPVGGKRLYLPMWEREGTKLNDFSGNGFQATLNGTFGFNSEPPLSYKGG